MIIPLAFGFIHTSGEWFSLELGIYAALFVLLLMLSAFFSGTESAVFHLDRGKLNRMKKDRRYRKKSRIQTLEAFLKKPTRFLSLVLLANLMVNFPISNLGDRIIAVVWHNTFQDTAILSLIVITVILLIFGEVVPKVVAIRNSESWAYRAMPIIQIWDKISGFFIGPVDHMAEAIVTKLPEPKAKMDEQSMIEAVRAAPNISKEIKERLSRWVIFSRDDAEAVMIRKNEIFMIRHDLRPSQAKKEFIEAGHSVALVYHAVRGDILGTIHVRNLISMIRSRKKSIRSGVRELQYVPSSMPLLEVIRKFRESKSEILGVIQETGEFAGMITIRDLFRALFLKNGEVSVEVERSSEEHPPSTESAIRKLKGGKYRVRGDISLHDFNDYFHTGFYSDDAETLSGYLLERLDGFPQKGTSFEERGFLFSNMKVVDFRISAVTVERIEK